MTEPPPRIAPLPNLPLFHQLAGRRAVVVGQSDGANWKAELLAAAGADVARLKDAWSDGDLVGAAIAVADIPEQEEAARFAQAARSAGAVVNLVDQPDLCDVQFGTIVNRAPLVIAISTDGAAPMLGQSIRTRLESVLPLGLSGWTQAAKSWRAQLKQRIPDFPGRRRFWARFVAAAWGEPDRMPGDADFDALVEGSTEARGRVTLIGTDPSDPELLTLKAARTLQTASVIFYDERTHSDVLELARREAERIPAGNDTNKRAVQQALAGENVVRLVSGDPRLADQIAACEAAGVELTVIPGVSPA